MNLDLRSAKRSVVAIALAALVLSACSSMNSDATTAFEDHEIATSITWGRPAAGAYDNVGTLLFAQGGVGYYSCTGTMIAPRVMLTAGHCVAGNGELNDVTYVRFEDDALSGIPDDGVSDEWLAKDWIVAERVIAHPMYQDYAAFPRTFDIGVVILSEPYTPASGFAELPDLGFLESLRGRDRQSFVVVGYGAQNTLRPFEKSDYEKYRGDVRLLEAKSYLNAKGAHSARFSNNRGIGGGTCYGDSGGPTFFQDTNLLVAVTSFGWAKNGNCIGNDFNFRTDTPVARDFIDEVLAEYGEEHGE